jgi:hypothetical protein
MDDLDNEYNELKNLLSAYERMVIDKNNPDYNQASIDRIYNELSFYLVTLKKDLKNNPSKKEDIDNLMKHVEEVKRKFGNHTSNKVLADTSNKTNINRLRNVDNDNFEDVFGSELDNVNDSLEGGRRSRRYKRRKSRRSKTRKRRRSKTRKRRSRK